jgi:ParB family transcriptional regulator, chromosome partitioning protein
MRLLPMPKRPELKGLGVQLLRSIRSDDSHPVETFTNDIDPAKVINLPITSIEPNPEQPRKFFDDTTLESLVNSIRQHGLLQPVVVRKATNGEEFTLIAGERRWRAAQVVGLRKIPALVRQHEDPLELALIENLQRQDLRPIEEAEALQKLKERQGLTDEVLAKIVGKSRSTVTEILTLNHLPDVIKEECRTSDKYQKSNLLNVVRQRNTEAQLALWTKIKTGNLSVHDTRKLRKKEQKTRSLQGYEFKYQPQEYTYIVRVKFRKSNVSQDDVKSALQQALKTLIE